VHAECEYKQHTAAAAAAGTDASSYVCPDCVSTARQHKEASNGLSGSRSKVRSGGIIGVNCNSRMSRERLQLDDRDQADPSKERQLQGGGGGAAASPKSKNLITIRQHHKGCQ
jgi:hypothetical protein